MKPGPQLKITKNHQKYRKASKAREGKSTMEAYKTQRWHCDKRNEKATGWCILVIYGAGGTMAEQKSTKSTKTNWRHGGWEGRKSLQTQPRHNDKTQEKEKHQNTAEAYKLNDDTVTKGTKKHQVCAFWFIQVLFGAGGTMDRTKKPQKAPKARGVGRTVEACRHSHDTTTGQKEYKSTKRHHTHQKAAKAREDFYLKINVVFLVFFFIKK